MDHGWAKTWGGPGADFGNSVAVDGSGHEYVLGTYQDSVDFNPGPGVALYTSHGRDDVYLSKFDRGGNLVWVRTWGETYWDQGNSVTVDSSGNVYTVGVYMETLDFDPGPGLDNHLANGVLDVFLSKFDSNGNFIWARTWGGIGDDRGFSVATDAMGNVFVAGSFNNTVDFDPGSGVDNHTAIEDDSFLSKFDQGGNFVWARTWGGSNYDIARSVAIDASGNAYVAGWFVGATDFDPGPGVASLVGGGAFLSQFDSGGNFVWVRALCGIGDSVGLSIAIDNSGKLYIAGAFSGAADFDPGPGWDPHTSNGGRDTFLSKFDSDGNFIWARTWGGQNPSNYDRGNSVGIDASGCVFVTGYFYGTVDFDPGPGVDNHTSGYGFFSVSADAFLSKFDPAGDLIWARTWGGDEQDMGFSVAVDSLGDAYVTGFYESYVDFNPGAGFDYHPWIDGPDLFLSKFPPDGNW
jgi:hypothetical protein